MWNYYTLISRTLLKERITNSSPSGICISELKDLVFEQ